MYLKLFPDGSEIEGNVGSDFVAYMENTEISEELERLKDDAPVFQAEVWTINKTVDWLDSIKELGIHVTLYIDSHAALKAVCNPYHNSIVVQETQGKLRKLKLDLRLQ